MLSSVALLSTRGEVLAFRAYRDDVCLKSTMNFSLRIVEPRLFSEVAPVQLLDGTSFLFIVEGQVVMVAASKTNSNAALLLSFLRSLAKCMRELVAPKVKFDEYAVRRNLCQIYEILDESMDFGVPQISNLALMRKCLVVEARKKLELCTASQLGEITTTMTTAVARPEGIKHYSNEIWVDVEEKVNVLSGCNGQLHAAYIDGVVQLRSKLSGMPQCHLGFNDALPLQPQPLSSSSAPSLDSVQLHDCVRLEGSCLGNEIFFTPPEGQCALVQYRAVSRVRVPLHVVAQAMEKSRTRVEFTVRVRGVSSVSGLSVRIPCPPNALKMNLIGCEAGRAKFLPEERAVVWIVRRLAAGKEVALFCEVERVSAVNEQPLQKSHILINFQMPMTTASGLTVRFLRVTEKSNYDTVKWIRYVTRAGTFQVRM